MLCNCYFPVIAVTSAKFHSYFRLCSDFHIHVSYVVWLILMIIFRLASIEGQVSFLFSYSYFSLYSFTISLNLGYMGLMRKMLLVWH